jgi:two-component system response regulator GlrR
MTAPTTRVLVAEDDRVARDLLSEILRGEGYEVEAVDDGAVAIERAQAGDGRYDLVVSDVRMERSGGLDVLAAFTAKAPATPVILITAFGDVSGAMEAIQRGAYDYVSKPFNIEELRLTVARALERRRLIAEQKSVPSEGKPPQLQDIVGKSAVMLDVYKLVARVAASTATVLVEGESGTGKELVARSIHTHSPRAGAPFLPVNCTALTESLLESELFGHARGAFTGAIQAHKGLFQAADAGTLFLDEIGDMPLPLQVKLLRVLQEGEVRPVGSTQAIPVDVRVISATHRDLDSQRDQGMFREDLFYRLNVVSLKLPALADRREDIPLLAVHILRKLAERYRKPPSTLAPDAMALLVAAPWPGNVRQLLNLLEQAVALSPTPVIPATLVQAALKEDAAALVPFEEARKSFERDYLVRLLKITGGNVTQAAQLAKRNRTEFYKLLQRHRLEPGMFKEAKT